MSAANSDETFRRLSCAAFAAWVRFAKSKPEGAGRKHFGYWVGQFASILESPEILMMRKKSWRIGSDGSLLQDPENPRRVESFVSSRCYVRCVKYWCWNSDPPCTIPPARDATRNLCY